ncbi:conjugal transfer protein TraG (plasmid) [Aeromonas media]|uniref:Conjugal transfer protein TraG n=1 Tax=Aeromonas media TaxID=651 RepID=A0ABX6NXX5_AERME|nr:conjugal transfer protein TraG N-terminal domain-containing protein [Aeromonas media]QJT36996.1 conjugal transfer protein TraG [Aeromonas media]QJT41238.1 conjugal transfer protein TraG [Aeromonas media]
MWDVYVSGNFEIIVAAYNALAMMFSDGHNIYYGAAILSLLMLLITSLMKLTDENQKPVHNFFFGLFIFIILGGPATKVTVLVESRVTQQVQTIDNVPLLVAISGSIATTLLSRITDDFQTAFQVIQPINNAGNTGFGGLDPLRTLVKLNQADYANAMICRVASGNTDLCDTMTNYIRDCVARDILTGGSAQETSIGKMMNTAPQESLLGIKSTNNYWSTQTAVKSGTPVVKTCAAMYTYIDSLVTSASFKTQVDRYNEFVGITPDSLESAGQIVMQAGMSAYDMAVQRMVWESARRGLSQAGDMIGVQTNMMQFTAKDQRLIKMASSYELFLELAPALITFFEFLAIFISPIMLIMLATGRFGFMAAGSYIMFILFTNLWPLMAVGVESYINFAMASDMSSTQGYGAAALSWNGTPGVIEKAQTYLAVGSIMMAAIPTLAMAVLFKGVHSMSGVASKASPDAPINPQYVSPNIAAAPNGGKVSMGEQNIAYAPNSVGPGVMSGSSPYASVMDSARAVQSEVGKSAQGAQQRAEQSAVAVQSSYQNLMSATKQALSSNQLGSDEKAGLSEDMSAFQATVSDYAKRHNVSYDQALSKFSSSATSFSQTAEAGIGTGKLLGDFIKAGFTLNAGHTSSDGKSETDASSFSDSTGKGQTLQHGMNSTQSSTLQKAIRFATGQSSSHSAEYKSAASNLTQASETYSEAKTNAEQLSAAKKSLESGAISARLDLANHGNNAMYDAKGVLSDISKDANVARVLDSAGIMDRSGNLTSESLQRINTLHDTIKAQSHNAMSESAIGSAAALTFMAEQSAKMVGSMSDDDRQAGARLAHALNEIRPHEALQQIAEFGDKFSSHAKEALSFGGGDHASNVMSDVKGGLNTQMGQTANQVGQLYNQNEVTGDGGAIDRQHQSNNEGTYQSGYHGALAAKNDEKGHINPAPLLETKESQAARHMLDAVNAGEDSKLLERHELLKNRDAAFKDDPITYELPDGMWTNDPPFKRENER